MTQVSRILRATHARTPLIKFLGKRSHAKVEETKAGVHPESPTGQLPSSFQAYRSKAIQHGPLATGKHAEASRGLVPARSQLESRYRYIAMSAEEMDAIDTGGATLFA